MQQTRELVKKSHFLLQLGHCSRRCLVAAGPAGGLQGLGFDTVSDNQSATRDQLNMASIDGQTRRTHVPSGADHDAVFGE
jgi:hypothetical protein